MKSFYFKLFSIILISSLGIVVYSNAFHCTFHFDDKYFIIDNYAIRDLGSLKNIWEYYPTRFFTFLSIALNYHFNKLDVFDYHVFNLAVHLTSAFLVWWLILLTLSTPQIKGDDKGKSGNKKKTFVKSEPAFKLSEENPIVKHAQLIALLVALVFVSHPLQTEAVTYIWQRAASMAALFYLASLCFYIKSRLLMLDCHPEAVRPKDLKASKDSIYQNRKGITSGSNSITHLLRMTMSGKVYYILALIIAIIAMFTKEDAITLPLTILLYEFSFIRTNKKFNFGFVVPFLLTILIIPSTILFTKSAMSHNIQGVVEAKEGITPIQYLLTQFRVIVTYIRLLIIPIHQNLDYDFPVYKSIFSLPVLTSFLFLSAIFYSAIRLFAKYRLLSFSLFWFFLTLVPESSVLPLQDLAFEHRLYLPMVGYALFLVSGIYNAIYFFFCHSERSEESKSSLRSFAQFTPECSNQGLRMTIVVLTIIIACNSILTYQRNKVWIDELTLWNDTIQKSPHKARPYNGRGLAYFDENNIIQAESDFTRAIELDPSFAKAYNNRGLVYFKKLDSAHALSDFNKAINFNPQFAEAYYNRATIYANENNFIQANSDFNRAIEINPSYESAYNNLGNLYGKEGKLNEAILDYGKAIELSPDYAEAYYNRGSVYGKQGNLTQAIADFTQAIEITPSLADAYMNRAVAYFKLKEYDQAWGDVQRVKELGAWVNPRFINVLKVASGR